MLEYLFGSKTRVRLLRLFFNDPEKAYFVRELTRKIEAQINSVRNELDTLVRAGLLAVVTDIAGKEDISLDHSALDKNLSHQKKFYKLNTDALLYPELRALFVKARLLVEKDFVQKILQTGSVSYLALTGFFVGQSTATTDIFLVGRVNRDRLTMHIRHFERQVQREINFTIMSPQEYKYRRDVTDRFLYNILDAKKIIVLDTLAERLTAKA